MHKSLTPIDVISLHTKDGDIVPIRIRIQDEDGIYQAYNIKSYKNLSHRGAYTTPDGLYVSNDILVYECKIMCFGREKIIRLYHNPARIIWQMVA